MAAMGHHTQACFYNPENLRNLKNAFVLTLDLAYCFYSFIKKLKKHSFKCPSATRPKNLPQKLNTLFLNHKTII